MKPFMLSIALLAAVVGGTLFAQNAEARGPRRGYGGVGVYVGGNRAYRPYYGGYNRPYYGGYNRSYYGAYNRPYYGGYYSRPNYGYQYGGGYGGYGNSYYYGGPGVRVQVGGY